MLKYAALMVVALMAAAIAADEPQPKTVAVAAAAVKTKTSADDLAWNEVIGCYKKPWEAIGCLESRMGRALAAVRDAAVSKARSDPDTAVEDVSGVGDLVQQIGEFITYGISSYFRGGGGGEDDDTTGASNSPAQIASDVSEEGRGHHKKKKIQKEIKKFVLKILFGIYLFKQKIKMILMSIQSILMSKFLVVAMIYALSNTFKIWYDIKWSKHHHGHDKVVYYENAHHQHHYEPPEHSDYDDPHHGSIWGRSIAVTEPTMTEHGSIGHHDGISRYIRRVSRTTAADAAAAAANGAQALAYQAQLPGL